MERKSIKQGIFLKTLTSYDDKVISVDKQVLQFPISFWPFKWKGFIGRQEKEFQYGEDIHYFFNTGKIFGRKTLYISRFGEYDHLPTTEEEMAEDDKDDLTLMQFSEALDEDEVKDLNEEDEEKDIEEKEEDEDKKVKEIKDEDENADLKLMTDTVQIRLPKEDMKEIEKILEASSAYKLKTIKCGGFFSMNQKLLAYDQVWALYVKPRLWRDSEIDSTPIHYMAFFLKTKSFLQLLFGGCGIYCGYHRQIDVEKISASAINEFYAWCKQYAPRLNSKGTTVTSSILANPLNLWRWIHPDRVTITDEAIIYTRRTLRRDEMIYLPYKNISIFLVEGGWFSFFKYFSIYGEQNIIPKFNFWRGDYSKIKNAIMQHNVRVARGNSWSSSIINPKNWFGRAPRLVEIDDRLVYYPNRLKSEMEDKKRMVTMKLSDIDDVTWHKGLFELLGTIEIKGRSKNIRKDQSDKPIKMKLPNLWCFSYKYFFLLWWSGSLRNTLKKSHASFHRDYQGSLFMVILSAIPFVAKK